MDPQKKKEACMSQIIRIAILGWSAALLTASYAGALAKMDPTFIATVFTASAATFGINTMKKGGDDDDEKKTEAKREEFVETPPTPSTEAVVEPVVEAVVEEITVEQPLVQTGYKEETSLEERVEALEAKVDEEKPYSRGDL
jgi:basic membrane lipoprotein Med (substrate-binding protein (PBP1-ABC) superfamily)